MDGFTASPQLTNYTLLGTNVSQQALKKQHLGRYNERKKGLIPLDCQQFIQLLLSESSTCKLNSDSSSVISQTPELIKEQCQVSESLRQYVSFSWHNIFTQDIATFHLQQLSICQNMLLYLQKFNIAIFWHT